MAHVCECSGIEVWLFCVQGPQWIGKKVEVYWDDDREWYSGVIVEHNPDHTNEQGDSTPYRIK